MKPTKPDIKIESTLEGEDVVMQLDPNAAGFLMDMFTDQYSDPELAPIREYSTNALDSHLEAGNKDPIIVNTPTSMRPTLEIIDQGVGLSADDIRNIYSKYGASTKRGTDEYTGMLGIGCKSALAYTNQFTLIGVKDGIKTSVSISRNEDGGGIMKILDEVPTDEKNGVHVIIPAPAHNRIEDKAKSLFRFWPKGSVLLNGKEPERILDKGLKIADNMYVFKDNSVLDGDYIVMGGIPFPYRPDDYKQFRLNCQVVVFVDIGEVHFPPNREELRYDTKTKNTIAKLKKEFDENATKAAEDKIKSAKTKQEALELYLDWSFLSSNSEVKWRGQVIPQTFNPPPRPDGKFKGEDEFRFKHQFGVAQKNSYRLCEERLSISSKSGINYIWVTNFKNKTVTRIMLEKMNKYVELKRPNIQSRGSYYGHAFCVTSHKKHKFFEWLYPDRIIDWEEAVKMKIERETRNKVAGTYKVYTRDSYWEKKKPADEIDTSKPIFWTTNGISSRDLDKLILFYPDCYIVDLPLNRVNKFKRDFSTAKTCHEGLQDAVKSWYNGLDSSTKSLLTYNPTVPYPVQKIKPEEIKDPKVRKILRRYEKRKKLDASIREKFSLASDIVKMNNEDYIVKEYPLTEKLASYNTPLPEHITDYMNAFYKHKQESKK